MRIMVEALRYSRVGAKFVGDLSPYAHQLKTLELTREAIRNNSTICIENASVTGSGKTLANFAAGILDLERRSLGPDVDFLGFGLFFVGFFLNRLRVSAVTRA